MAGYREFQTGEVLTAANVNSFLMEQATMTFADAAARDAALAGVLREGLLTYNLDEGRLEVYDGTDWVEPAPEPPAGIGSNVVQTVKTDTFVTSSATFVIPTGLEATITPTSDTSKVLVIATLAGMFEGGIGGRAGFVTLFRSTTNLSNPDDPGDRTPVFSGFDERVVSRGLHTQSVSFLDTPSAAVATTYSVRVRVTGGGDVLYVNRQQSDGDITTEKRAVSTLTLIEVAP